MAVVVVVVACVLGVWERKIGLSLWMIGDQWSRVAKGGSVAMVVLCVNKVPSLAFLVVECTFLRFCNLVFVPRKEEGYWCESIVSSAIFTCSESFSSNDRLTHRTVDSLICILARSLIVSFACGAGLLYPPYGFYLVFDWTLELYFNYEKVIYF